jgi:tight adherence protein C
VALARASDRTGIGELRSLGSLLGQTERFGSDLARTLEVMADSLRHEEMQTIEERAHRASVKMLFPLAALMLPATLLLIVAPLLLLLFEALMKATA